MFEKIKHFLIKLNLQRFGDGGGAGGAAGGEGGTAGADAATGAGTPAESQAGPKMDKAAERAQTIRTMSYGKTDAADAQEDAPEETAAPEKPAQPAKRQSFDEVLKSNPEYAREMQKRIDQAINKRFAKAKAAEEQSAKLTPALNLLAAKYGIEAGNTEALIDAINGDSDLIEQQAMDAGMEPDAYREFTRLKAENEAFKQAAAERERQARLDNAYNQWMREADEARRIYPGLDLRTEIQNDQFAQMLGAGINVKTAYEAVHMEEIQQGLLRNAAQEAVKKTVAGIAAKQGRPRENGASKPRAASVKTDVHALTRADFDEIARRAARGEKIRF